MSHQKGDVIESVQDVGPYVVIAIKGGDMSTFTHARQDCLAMMLMEFFDKHPDIYDTMWQMKVAVQLAQLAKIDLCLGAKTATEVQQLINSGNLELAEAKLASAERMQEGRIESEEGMFADEMEFQEAMATGQINGMPTLEGMLTRAELADRLTARQAESLGQLLALANAMPEPQRATTMASIVKPMQELMEGRGYTDLKLLMIDLMGPDAENYGFED